MIKTALLWFAARIARRRADIAEFHLAMARYEQWCRWQGYHEDNPEASLIYRELTAVQA
jgi:hypothetical protein